MSENEPKRRTRACRYRVWRDRAACRAGGRAPVVKRRGYDRLYDEHVLQADEGVDFDFC